jgi:hypothetical protein
LVVNDRPKAPKLEDSAKVRFARHNLARVAGKVRVRKLEVVFPFDFEVDEPTGALGRRLNPELVQVAAARACGFDCFAREANQQVVNLRIRRVIGAPGRLNVVVGRRSLPTFQLGLCSVGRVVGRRL